jgi:ribosomal protein L1
LRLGHAGTLAQVGRDTRDAVAPHTTPTLSSPSTQVLGPKGLMPNVKLGTLTSNVAFAIRELRRGRLDFRVDRDGNMHAALGKVRACLAWGVGIGDW